MIYALRKHSGEFKLRIVIESFQKNKVAAVARRYSVHPNLLRKWRRELIQRGECVFERCTEAQQFRKRITELEKLICKKDIEINVLKSCVDQFVPSRSSLAEYARSTVALGRTSINAICLLLGISKKTYYASRSREDRLKIRHEMLSRMILEIVERHPSFGYRRIKAALADVYGIRVNHKLVKKLLVMLPRERVRSEDLPTRMVP
jgi:transposase-like protein